MIRIRNRNPTRGLVRWVFALLVAGALSFAASSARAEENEPARFAIVMGVNRSVDTNLAPLKYADDDAARWRDLFKRLGVQTRVLARLDDNTKRVHPDLEKDAALPVAVELDRAVSAIATEAAAARARGKPTHLYVVYAGHGDVRNGQGYITLEDARLTGKDLLDRVLKRVGATRSHVIVDACGSFYLAYGRGPGGERRALDAASKGFELTADPSIGILLSTSSARDSHEWDAVQGGVFSHEVRSGLLGAADADGDGKITYREIAAFVARANAGIPNEKYRPDLHARAPASGDSVLVDVKQAQTKRIEIDGAHAGHYVIESATGVRLAELHTARGQKTTLVRPSDDKLYLLRLGADPREFTLAPGGDVVTLASLDAEEPRARSRGALHEAFEKLFTVPFDQQSVADYREPSPEAISGRDDATTRPGSVKRTVGWIALGVGAVGLATAGGLALWSSSVEGEARSDEAQSATANRNAKIETLNTAAIVSVVAGSVAVAAGGALLLWPEPVVIVSKGGAVFGLGARF